MTTAEATAVDWRTFEPTSYSLAILRALNLRSDPMYAGTADPIRVADRRSKNRRAAASRRINRR